ncbi:tudor domain-containing protein 1 [Nephila pilipes]|uniref:Tudor domain-containing protein 1 n=1 Tax=Nephila pilipes TaxID=299642 RepID=A0A8X6NLY8_NEPPI|nr:tudor domain-containing protein 1 [Nephila pilipes]
MAQIRQPTPKDAVITFIKGEGGRLKFWALPVSSLELVKTYENHFMKISNDLANSPGLANSSQIPVGYLCAVLSQYKRQWCRARVINVSFSDIVVKLLDYGNEERLSCKDVRKLDDNLSHCKGQAIECILADVWPVHDKWTPEAIHLCEQQLLYETVSCFVVTQFMDIPVVRIAKKGEKEPFVQRLINSNLAFIKSETPNQQMQPVVQPLPNMPYKMNVLDQNTTHLVRISYINPAAQKFFVQLAAAEVELKKMMEDIKMYTSTETLMLVNSPQINTPCLATYNNQSLFYRAIITPFNHNQFSTHFVDYGCSEVKSYKDLRAIPNNFLSLPAQAICCCLVKGETEDLFRFAKCGLLNCHVVGFNGEAYLVHLTPHAQEPVMHRPFTTPTVLPMQTLVYQHQKLKINTAYDVAVSYTNDISEFYCQLTHYKEQLDNISNILNSGYEHETLTIGECVPNFPVCVKFSEDHLWYRAQVVKVNHENDIEVFFVDFGNYDNSALRDVCRLKPDFLELPMQAHKCCLHEVESPTDSTQKDDMFDLFEELTAGQTLVAHIHSVTNDHSHAITLKDKNSTTSINKKIISKFMTIPPLEVSDIEQLYITFFESPASFFAQFEKLSSMDLEKMQVQLNEHYANSQNSSFKPKVGTYVCAKFSVDNMFYRAQVANIVGTNYEVNFIDYGNKDTVPSCNIHPLDKKFMIHPHFGVECGLKSFPPATPVEKLKSLLCENSIRAQMLKTENNKWLIALTEDFTGNVAILELLRQHETLVPRSIHGAGLKGFQGKPMNREEPAMVSNEFRHPKNGYQSLNKLESGKPGRNEQSVNRNNEIFSSPPKEKQNNLQSYSKSFDITSIPPRAYRNVYVSHVLSPSEFYCQIEEESTKLQVMMKSIEDTYTNIDDNFLKLENLTINSPCCAMFEEDGGWYRAQIKQISTDTCTVYYIDYGNTDAIHVSKVKELQREFFNLPPQAIRCKSYNVSPKSESWDSTDIEAFVTMTLEKSFVAQFVESDENGIYSVNLVSIGKLQEDVLNKEFVSLGHGRLEDSSKIIVLNPHAASSNLTFPVPEVDIGSRKDVIVTYGLNPGEVFCQLKSFEKNFKKMMLDMQDYYNKVSAGEALIDRPHQNMICVCQFSLDSAWYRAEIKKVEKNSLTVLYVDYGNCEIVDKKKICSINQDFTLLPIQGIKCHLKGIKPLEKTWTTNQNISRYFEGDIYCHFLAKQEDSFIVDMFCNQRNIAEYLIKDGLALSDIPVVNQEFPLETLESIKPQVMQPLLQREISFATGQLLSVIVSFIESPFKFWCQLMDEAEILEQLVTDIESQYLEGSHPIDAIALNPGTYCMVKYSVNETWYRAQIKSCLPEKEFEVFYIDYGNSEVTTLSEIAAILPQFLEIPPQCFQCCLLKSSSNCDMKATEKFQAEVDEAEDITAKVENVINNICTLSLLIEKDGEEINISDLLFEKDSEEVNVSPSNFDFSGEMCTSLPIGVPRFLPPDVPLGNQEGLVIVINSPHDFFIQLAANENGIDELLSELCESCESKTEAQNEIHNPCVGYACCAKFSEDNNWYRAEVINLEETTAEVLFVDYGNINSVPKDTLKPLDPKFLDIPPYAIRCKLNGITSTNDQWSDVAIEAFQDMVLNCQLGITFISKDIPAIVNISKEDKDVAQSLIDMELANVDTCPETEEAYADDHLTTVEDQLHSLPSDLSYPQRKLSSSKLPVKISYVDSYDKFYVTPLELSTELDTVMKTLEILYSPSDDTASNSTKTSVPDVLEDPCVSLPCVAKYSEDGAWYRAVISDIEGENIYVYFVDYGNSEVSSLKNLRPLTPELIKIPPIAIECKLYAIQANDGKETEITAKLEEYFIEELELDMQVFKLSEPYEVRLYHDGDLAEILCQKGLATEVIPPLENVQKLLTENLNENGEKNLEICVESPNDTSCIVPLRSFNKEEMLVDFKHWELENDIIVVYGVPNEIDGDLTDFQEKLQLACNENEQVPNINIYDFCVARYIDDEKWYRAQVVAISGDNFKVKLIDYGNSEIVKLEHICKLPVEFINQPQFSTKFCLSGFKVIEGQNDNLQIKIEEYLYSDHILVKLCKYSCNVPNICITNMLCEDVDIVKVLLNDQLVSPQYITNAQFSGEFKATVENIVEDLFYLFPIQFIHERKILQNSLTEVCCEESLSFEEFNPRSLYAAKVKDNWSRVSITRLNDSSTSALVNCVDYGFETELELTRLAVLPEEFWHKPLMILQCTITNFEESSCNIKEKDMEKFAGNVFLFELKKSFPLKYPFEVKLLEKDSNRLPDTNQEHPSQPSEIIGVDEKVVPSEDTVLSEVSISGEGKKAMVILENAASDEELQKSNNDEEEMTSIPECEFNEQLSGVQNISNDIETCDLNSSQSSMNSPKNVSNLILNETELSNLTGSEIADNFEESNDIHNPDHQNSEIKEQLSNDNDLSFNQDKVDHNYKIQDDAGTLLSNEVENYRVESSELENLNGGINAEGDEWDERPECDIKQNTEQVETKNNESFEVAEEQLSEEKTSFQNIKEEETNNSEKCKDEFTEDSLELHNNIADKHSSGDIHMKEIHCSESDSKDELYSDVLTDIVHQQLSGKVDVYVSDIVISNGSVVLTVIPYDLHLKLISTLGETFQNIYSKKEPGLKSYSVSDLCVVCSDDTWFRGKILNLVEDKMDLFLIDYGITKTVDRALAVDLEPEHKTIPPFAVKCSLASVYCPPDKSDDTKNFLCDLLANVQATGKDVSIEVIKTEDHLQQVNLFLVHKNVLFELLSHNLITQKLSTPITNPGKYNAQASYIDTTSGSFQLYINLVDELDDLQSLRDTMNNSYPLSSQKASVVESGVFAVMHKATWHRGRITSCNNGPCLFLVDSGETISVDSDLYPLLPEHTMQPPFAMPCQLPGKIIDSADVLLALKDIFTTDKFLVSVDIESESYSLNAKVMDEALMEKIKNVWHSGQSIASDPDST